MERLSIRALAAAAGLAAASLAQAAPVMMSAEWAREACTAWNGDPALTEGLAKSEWIKNDKGRGYKVIHLYRTDCKDSRPVELRIGARGARAECVYGGAIEHASLDGDADYLMHAWTSRWVEMGKGEYGPTKAMSSGAWSSRARCSRSCATWARSRASCCWWERSRRRPHPARSRSEGDRLPSGIAPRRELTFGREDTAMRSRLVALAAIAAAGCATTPPPAQAPDDTPTHPTAVIETHVSSSGLKGMFPFETNERRYVRADVSRDETTFKGTGTFSGFLVNMFGPNEDAVIERPDRGLRWTLDLRKKEYTQCPLEGCSEPGKPAQSAASRQGKQPTAKREPGCVMHVARTHFSVKARGRKLNINGFDATEYRVAWIVTLRDRKGRHSTSTLDIDAWTAPLTHEMREALHLQSVYARAYGRSLHGRAGSRPHERAGELPPGLDKAILGYIGQLSAHDRAALLAAGRRLERLKGHPVRMRVDWNYEGNACAESESRQAAKPESSASFMSGLGSLFSSKKDSGKKGSREPLFSMTYEIKSLKMENVHDGKFAVPKGFRRVQS